MRDYGAFFRRERQQLGMRQCDLADGICTVDTISRIETGSQVPSPVLFTLLIERLGVSGFSYGDFFDTSSIHLMQLQRQIVDSLDRNTYDDVPFLLNEYQSSMEKTSWDKQFYLFSKGWYFFRITGNHSSFLECCKHSMKVRHPNIGTHTDFSSAYFTQNEYRILNAVATVLYESSHSLEALALLNQLILNQKSAKDILPAYSRNLAVLYNNAAICEKHYSLADAMRHIRLAEKSALIYGNPLMNLRISKTRLLHFNTHSNIRSRTLLLQSCFVFVNAAMQLYKDFWDFLSEPCFMNILW
ncbi:MAG: helix-turn-helix domain-containing protein [Lachnospiraceae bacterium]|nr:helix-turn-helix domain-containing protein [Lachnospiraceae bacterium]